MEASDSGCWDLVCFLETTLKLGLVWGCILSSDFTSRNQVHVHLDGRAACFFSEKFVAPPRMASVRREEGESGKESTFDAESEAVKEGEGDLSVVEKHATLAARPGTSCFSSLKPEVGGKKRRYLCLSLPRG